MSKIIKIYDYTDETGNLLYQVCRYEPKAFGQRRPDPDNPGQWLYNLNGIKPVLYRLPELINAPMQDWVYIVEGEKDCDRLFELGFVATTCPMGAGKWRNEYNRYLSGRLVAVIGDNDNAGRKHAEQISNSLYDIAAEIRIVELPNLPEKGDVSNWLDKGGTAEEMLRLTDKAPIFKPELIDSPQPIIVSLAEVKPLQINWLWFNRIPLGMFTLILGDPGLGKSFLTLYMAAKVSTGGAWPDDGIPDNNAPKGSVVILTAEDDLSYVVRPRLDALEADTTKIIALEGVKTIDKNDHEHTEYFNLQKDLPALRQAVRQQNDTKLVIIDPLSAYLGGKIDSHKNSDVRSVLMPLVQLAEDCNVAVIGVTHLNKNASGKAVYRALGSIAFLASARTCWLVSADPNDSESNRRLLTPVKHNILREPTGLAFEIVESKVVFENEPVAMSADEALASGSTIKAQALDEAKKWLSEQLTPGKSITANEIYKMADEEGISKRTLERAKKELNIVSYQETVMNKKVWFWTME